MAIDNALTSLAESDVDTATAWYARILGFEGSSPMDGLMEWSFPAGGVLQVDAGPERSGTGSCTLVVTDPETEIERSVPPAWTPAPGWTVPPTGRS